MNGKRSILVALFAGIALAFVNCQAADEVDANRDRVGVVSAPVRANAATFDNVPYVIAVQCVIIVLASLAGGWLPQLIELTHTRMQLMISFVGGLMLGIGMFHMLPHSVAELGDLDRSLLWTMIGFLSMFFLLRAFHFHQHGPADSFYHESGQCEDDEPHSHDHDATQSQSHARSHVHGHKLSWAGIAFGLSIHTMIDGAALAASVEVDAAHDTAPWLLGIGTFLAVVLHKPLDAVSITSLMAASRWSAASRTLVNFGFSLMCPFGAVLFLTGIRQFADFQHVIVGCALAFSAGVFMCISMSDLLPEVEFHSHDRGKLSLALLLGVALAYGIGFLEPEDAHSKHKHNENRDAAAGNAIPGED